MSLRLFGPVLLAVLLVFACSSNKSLLNEEDPFDDPFFSEGLGSGTDSLDEILREPAPSVGWLAREGAQPPTSSARERAAAMSGSGSVDEGVLLQAEGGEEAAEDVYTGGGEEDDEAFARARGQKSFYERASEATLATMSVLVGAGMAALPFLVGT
ncbi:MAG: hypothetical protein AB1689_20385 [Thermodesulfobacteriota bacterium]